MSTPMMYEKVWFDRSTYEQAEIHYHEKLAKSMVGIEPDTISQYLTRVDSLESENQTLRDTVGSLLTSLKTLEDRVRKLELGGATGKPASAPAKAAPAPAAADDDDDDIDLFGSDDDDVPAVTAPIIKKVEKTGPIAKSLIVLYVKPWDDTTDMAEMERCVRTVQTDGLVWGSAKLVPVAYGVKMLQIACVVEDDKVGTDFLEDSIQEFEDFVQSVDVASFNKV